MRAALARIVDLRRAHPDSPDAVADAMRAEFPECVTEVTKVDGMPFVRVSRNTWDDPVCAAFPHLA